MASMSALASNDLAAQAKERPSDPMVHFANALAHEFRGDRGTAMKEIDRVLETDPSNEIFYYTKAGFAWTRGKPKDAIRVLQACVAAVPSIWRCYEALGDDYGREGDKQQALDALTAAEGLAPGDAAVQFELGLAYAALGQDQEAAAALEKTLALGASHANVHYNLGGVYARLANYDAAWLHARIAEHQGYPAADLISRLAQLAPEPIW
ncbi:MAG: tetratricopeptide repeat protein [Deltaproteobacteria bacterium]|nr:MAG: tetratricopeptide repeat protein [Deltaproteobacteria bacterium]